MQFRLKTLSLSLALAFAVATAAQAADTKNYRVVNNSTLTAKDLHITFTGTGGSLNVVILNQPAACGDATIAYSGGGNTVDIDWPENCVPVGGLVTIRASTANGPLSPSSGTWTYEAPDPPQNINVGTDITVTNVPTVSQWGLIIMTLLLLTAATIIFARRRPAAAQAH
jgi:hypothetical protein